MFEKYWQDKKEYDEKQAETRKLVTPLPAQSAVFNHSILFKTIEDRQSMSDSELCYFINNNYNAILNNIFNPTVANKYIDAFKDIRFLDAFIDVFSRIKYFDPDNITRINLVIYHYISLMVQDEVFQRMMRLSQIVNHSKLTILKKYNLPEQLENVLVISRFSDFRLQTCVKRVDLTLIASPALVDILNIDENVEVSPKAIDFLAKLLVDLYDINNFIYIIPYMMLDVLPEVDDTPATQWITNDVQVLDSALSLAILQILDTMIPNSNILREILESYAEGYRIMNRNSPIRFSFQRISAEYPRLLKVIEYLRDERKIYVP